MFLKERYDMKFKHLMACSLMISAVTLTGCSSGTPDISLSSDEESSVETEENTDQDKTAEDDSDSEASTSEDSENDSEESKKSSDAENDSSTKNQDDNEKTERDSNDLLQAFLDDEIEAIEVSEDGSESSFKYSDLPHDEDDWECYYYDDDSFVDLDNDSEEELIVYGPYGGIFFDVRDNNVYVLATGDGTASYLSYAEYEGLTYIVHSDTSHGGRSIHLFDRYEDGEIVESFDLSAEYYDSEYDEYDQNSDFTFNGESITMEEYEALCKEIFGTKTKAERMKDSAEYEAENFDYSADKIVNDGSAEFYEKVNELAGDYYYPEDSDGLSGTFSIIQNSDNDYSFNDYYTSGDYRFLSSSSDIEYFIGDSICLKYPETVYSDGEAVFAYYVFTFHDSYVHVYLADENYENLEYLYTGYISY